MAKTAERMLEQVARIRKRFPVMSAARRACVDRAERRAICTQNEAERGAGAGLHRDLRPAPVRFVRPEKLAAALLEQQSRVKIGLGRNPKEH